jgi:hypothetical protein
VTEESVTDSSGGKRLDGVGDNGRSEALEALDVVE